MTEFSAVTDGIRGYAATAADMSAQVRTAAAGAAATGPGLLVPVFGLIGGDFLAAYSAAHGAHTAALSDLAGTLESLGGAATATATAYDEAERGVASGLVASGSAVAVPA